MERGLAALRDVLETRLDGMDRASVLLHENMSRIPSDTDKQIAHVRQLHDQKFEGVHSALAGLSAGIQKQFDERDVRSKAAEDAAKVAVNAALQAQKEAAGAQNESNAAAILKSESATVKQIDGILALLASSTKGTDEKIASINGRLDRGEGQSKGVGSALTVAMAVVATVIALGGLIVSFAAKH